MKSSECEYEILNPCAEAAPIPPRGISPRLTDLTDKTIGLYAIARKSAARPILGAVEQKLKERFPTLKFSWFVFQKAGRVALSEDKARFEEWVKGIDAAVTAVGD